VLLLLLWGFLGVLTLMAGLARGEIEEGKEEKDWCLDAGFNPETLKCSTCTKLASTVNHEGT
jgi:hypothetical protein